jgi:hypothetical protein
MALKDIKDIYGGHLERLWQISRNLSMKDLIDEGVDTTTARMIRAVWSLHRRAGVTSLYLSKLKVKTGFLMPVCVYVCVCVCVQDFMSTAGIGFYEYIKRQ